MSGITKDEINEVAKMAKLKLTADELDHITHNINSIFKLADKLHELDTTDVPPTSNVLEIRNVLRKDEVGPSLSQEEALKNAPEQEDGQIKVPRTL